MEESRIVMRREWRMWKYSSILECGLIDVVDHYLFEVRNHVICEHAQYDYLLFVLGYEYLNL